MKAKSKQWFVRRGKTVKGPFQTNVIEDHLLLGRLRVDDELSLDKTHWQAAQNIELFSASILTEEQRNTPEIQEKIRRIDERKASRTTDDKTNTPQEGSSQNSDTSHMQQERMKARERRQHESDDILEYRAQRAEVMESLKKGSKQKRVTTAVLGVFLIVVTLVYVAINYQATEELAESDCSSAPMPGVNWSYCDLTFTDLSNQDVSESDLSHAQLQNARLLATKLNGARLNYADLRAASMLYAELQNAILKGADLSQADLSFANLEGADLSYANLTGVNLNQANLQKVNFSQAIWVDKSVCQEDSIGECRR